MLLKLRRSVSISANNGSVTLRNPVFEMNLPKDWIDATPPIKTLLNERSVVKEELAGKESLNVIEALQRTGFMAFDEKEEFKLRECRAIFDSLASEWYAEYYTHPLWNRARNGQLSHTGLLAWLIHNYHISIAAGITDARAAASMPTAALRSFFRENCLEEYWHCDAFYFVRHPNLHVNDELIKRYVPLPSSTAFKQQAIRTAEKDWIANVLISYFQESSIRFYNDCLKFYSQVEQAYNIPGMFKTWLQHMSLDFEHSHADVLGELLENDVPITKTQLLSSFQSAHQAFRFLMTALDEVLLEDQLNDHVYLRNPVLNKILDPEQNSFVKGLSTKLVLDHDNPSALYDALKENLSFNAITYNDAECAYLNDQFATSFFKALSYSSTHDEVILFGKLADKYVRIAGTHEEQTGKTASMAALALANFIDSLASRPRILAFVLKHLCHLAPSESISPAAQFLDWLPITRSGKYRLDMFLDQCKFSAQEIDDACTAVIQCNEIINRKPAYDKAEPELYPFG